MLKRKLLLAASAVAVMLGATPAEAKQLVIWYDASWNEVGRTLQLDNNYICWSVGTYGVNYQWWYVGPDSGNPATDCTL